MKKDKENAGAGPASRIETISAVTLATHDMERAVRFYRSLGFTLRYGGEHASFTSFFAGVSYLNLIHQPETRRWSWWGRVIFYVSDVDALDGVSYRRHGSDSADLGKVFAKPPGRSSAFPSWS